MESPCSRPVSACPPSAFWEELEAPNPYNAGTELEGTPWRSTFIDGVSANHVVSQHMLEKYGVPMTIMTTRMYYNVSLLRRITGSEDPPRTYSEFIEFGRLQSLGDQSRDYRSMETHTLYQQARREAGLNRWASAIAEFGDRVD